MSKIGRAKALRYIKATIEARLFKALRYIKHVQNRQDVKAREWVAGGDERK